MKHLFTGALLAAALVGAQSSQASLLFSDNFNSENGGVGTLNYAGFANWNVTVPTIDLIGNGFFDFLPGNGLYLDMDGSPGAGTLESKTTFTFLAGQTYVLSYDVAGSQRGQVDSMTVSVGGGTLVNDTETLPSAQGFTLVTDTFTPLITTTSTLSFKSLDSRDSVQGLLLDNVSLTESDVPEPANGGLLCGAGLLALVAASFRKTFVKA